MSRYFDEMKSIVEGLGGVVEPFRGDEVMAVFGVPTVHEDDALAGGADRRWRCSAVWSS